MNCVRCGARLEASARFCRNCGLPTAASQSQNGFVPPSKEQEVDKTISISSLVEQLHKQPTYPQQPQASPQEGNTQPAAYSPGPAFSQFSPSAQPQNSYQVRDMERGMYSRPSVVSTPPRRNRVGCVLGCLGTLLVVLLLLGVTWVFALHPYVHNLAVTQMDGAMTSIVNQLPPVGLPIPSGTTVPIAESTLNNVIANNVTDSPLVQNTSMQITSNQVLLDFEVYGQHCTITSVPQMQDGKLVATHVTVSGIASLVLSPQDVTNMLDSHLEAAQQRINRRVTNVHLADQEIDVTFA